MGLIVVMGGQEVDASKPRYQCLACGATFRLGEERAYERHVAGEELSDREGCAERHAERMQSESLRTKAPALFDPFQSGDVELGRWISRHRGELLEGRRKL